VTPDYYALSDALQYLGNVAFRAPVPAYKHSAATFLHLRGLIPSSSSHPRAPVRPVWEADILRDCAERLGYSSKKAGLLTPGAGSNLSRK
jgi:4-hydroxy-tetrahydrodipicolinate synthase